jgi:hypothetical protein
MAGDNFVPKVTAAGVTIKFDKAKKLGASCPTFRRILWIINDSARLV